MIHLGTLYRGDTPYFDLTVSDETLPVDLTVGGTELVFTATPRTGTGPGLRYSIGDGITIVNATSAQVTCRASDTAALTPVMLDVLVVLSEPDGRVTTLGEWSLAVR